MKEKNIIIMPKSCPLCEIECEKYYIENKFSICKIVCPKCKDFIFETMPVGKSILDKITADEKLLLADYFSKLPAIHDDRRIPITISNYKEFVERAKKYKRKNNGK